MNTALVHNLFFQLKTYFIAIQPHTFKRQEFENYTFVNCDLDKRFDFSNILENLLCTNGN